MLNGPQPQCWMAFRCPSNGKTAVVNAQSKLPNRAVIHFRCRAYLKPRFPMVETKSNWQSRRCLAREFKLRTPRADLAVTVSHATIQPGTAHGAPILLAGELDETNHLAVQWPRPVQENGNRGQVLTELRGCTSIHLRRISILNMCLKVASGVRIQSFYLMTTIGICADQNLLIEDVANANAERNTFSPRSNSASRHGAVGTDVALAIERSARARQFSLTADRSNIHSSFEKLAGDFRRSIAGLRRIGQLRLGWHGQRVFREVAHCRPPMNRRSSCCPIQAPQGSTAFRFGHTRRIPS